MVADRQDAAAHEVLYNKILSTVFSIPPKQFGVYRGWVKAYLQYFRDDICYGYNDSDILYLIERLRRFSRKMRKYFQADLIRDCEEQLASKQTPAVGGGEAHVRGHSLLLQGSALSTLTLTYPQRTPRAIATRFPRLWRQV